MRLRKHFNTVIFFSATILWVIASGSLLASTVSGALPNTYCPVTTDEKVEPDIWVDYQGRRIHFCCRDCRKDFIDNPTGYLTNLQNNQVEQSLSSVGSHDHSKHNHTHRSKGTDPDNTTKGQPDELTTIQNHEHDHTGSRYRCGAYRG